MNRAKKKLETVLKGMTQQEFASCFKGLHQSKVSRMVKGDYGQVYVHLDENCAMEKVEYTENRSVVYHNVGLGDEE